MFECGHCKNSTTCDSVTGFCLEGCQEGWAGYKCKIKSKFIFHISWWPMRFKFLFIRLLFFFILYFELVKLSIFYHYFCFPCWFQNSSFVFQLDCNHSIRYHKLHLFYFTACPDQFYGKNCEQRCGNCKGGLTCNYQTGVCENGCEMEWKGEKCQQQVFAGQIGTICLILQYLFFFFTK